MKFLRFLEMKLMIRISREICFISSFLSLREAFFFGGGGRTGAERVTFQGTYNMMESSIIGIEFSA